MLVGWLVSVEAELVAGAELGLTCLGFSTTLFDSMTFFNLGV